MSFGTNVRSDRLSSEKRKTILSAFADLPQRVLWKFESDLPDVPKNVLVRKWFPQNDILGKYLLCFCIRLRQVASRIIRTFVSINLSLFD